MLPPLIIALFFHVSFLSILSLVGGILISLEMILVVTTYWGAVRRRAIVLTPAHYGRRVAASIAVVALAVCLLGGTLYALLSP
jgi:hypothetical protein